MDHYQIEMMIGTYWIPSTETKNKKIQPMNFEGKNMVYEIHMENMLIKLKIHGIYACEFQNLKCVSHLNSQLLRSKVSLYFVAFNSLTIVYAGTHVLQ